MLIFELLFTYCVGKNKRRGSVMKPFMTLGRITNYLNGCLACACVCVAPATPKAQEGYFLVGMGTETKYTSVREQLLWQELKRRPETLPSCLYIKTKLNVQKKASAGELE